MLRTHKCNEVKKENVWEIVTLSWWVSNRRDHGGIIFIDLRDRYGLTQVVFDPKDSEDSWKLADTFRSEYVIKVTGSVRARPEGQANPNMETWEIEIIINDNVEILSKSKTPPFEIDGHGELANEEIRYKHRYIDLRRSKALENVKFRSKFVAHTKNWFLSRDFLDVQTPIFTASSPEGARDFVIPSRLHPGKFYALPQAPQQYKQLLMVGWIDKYFQIAPCFRDEDPRADRHACEFYQIDCEMSFVEQEDIFQVVESYFTDLVPAVSKKTIMDQKFYRMTFDESIEIYGTDKPDLRYWMKLIDVADIFAKSTNEIFSSIASDTTKNRVKAIKVEKWDEYFSKTQMKNFEKFVRQFWAQGLGYFQMKEDGLKGPLNKFFSEDDLQDIVDRTDLKTGDVIFFWAADKETVCDYMGKFRVHLSWLIDEITKGEFIDKNILAFSWITDFPMFEINEITGKVDFGHNPFSMPKGWIKAFEETDLLKVSSVQYDLSCNGFEVLSGSIRNHDIAALVQAFEKVGRTEKEVAEKFGAMYEAFQYWVPPHGWFAIWMDRIMMILKDEPNIREVYAFPKSGKAQDLMMNAPTFIDDTQLEELHIEIVEKYED
jgi:aspartyl-tRNA synthetase